MSDLILDLPATDGGTTLVLAYEGWNDAGEAASGAARFLIESLALEPCGELDAEPFLDLTVVRPTVEHDEQGRRRIAWPTLRFFAGEWSPGQRLVVGIGPEPHFQWRTHAALLERVVESIAAERVVLLGAYLADVLYSLPVRITGFASDEEEASAFSLEGSGYEGPTGIVGVLGEALARDGTRVLSLWAGLPHYIDLTPNPRGALALAERLGHLLLRGLDLSPLVAASAEFEERATALVAADPSLLAYVKELKRRGFAP